MDGASDALQSSVPPIRNGYQCDTVHFTQHFFEIIISLNGFQFRVSDAITIVDTFVHRDRKVMLLTVVLDRQRKFRDKYLKK